MSKGILAQGQLIWYGQHEHKLANQGHSEYESIIIEIRILRELIAQRDLSLLYSLAIQTFISSVVNTISKSRRGYIWEFLEICPDSKT